MPPYVNRNSRAPFNPAMNGMMFIPVPGNTPSFDDGYRRFAECMKCNKTFKIFICFKGSEKSCNASDATHTHLNCECTEVKFAGAVQLKTKKDKTSTTKHDTVTLTKEEAEEYRKLKAASKEEE